MIDGLLWVKYASYIHIYLLCQNSGDLYRLFSQCLDRCVHRTNRERLHVTSNRYYTVYLHMNEAIFPFL